MDENWCVRCLASFVGGRTPSGFGVHLTCIHVHTAIQTNPPQLNTQTVVVPPKGLYLHGGVGTGKTFLMDLFYEASLCAICIYVCMCVH